jgi:hypothetical protein
VSTLRTLVSADGRLFTSPTGSGRAWNAAQTPAVHATHDPAARRWTVIGAPGFGDPSNHAVYTMAAFEGCVYAGTLNPTSGYQVWKAPIDADGDARWERVVAHGAHRGNLNEAAMTMCVFGDALYVGSGISNGGYDRTYGIGPSAGELIRIFPDDTWELVAGEARPTPVGRKEPLSGLGPGFGNPFAGYIWSMAVHDGHLYVGTFDSSVFALWADLQRLPIEAQLKLRRLGVDRFVEQHAGFDLFRSKDGASWTPVTRNGFGNPYNYGARTMISTPYGLFVGTANPFGPDVATRLAHGWEYAPNPRGGLEVWLGAGPDGDTRPYASDVIDAGEPAAQLRDHINAAYDRKMYSPLMHELYEGSDYYNFGYWERETHSL